MSDVARFRRKEGARRPIERGRDRRGDHVVPMAHEWLSRLIGLRVVVNHSIIARLVGVGDGFIIFEAEGGRIRMRQRDVRALHADDGHPTRLTAPDGRGNAPM
jgi:hypothetical protein